MDLTELQAEVIIHTGRPDKVADTLSAVKAATLKAHQLDYFPRDIYETGLSFNTAEFEQDFEVTTFIPRFRAIKFARVYDNDAGSPLQFFELIDPINVLDTYNVARTDVMYLGGSEIHFKASAEFQYALFGCYLNPDVATMTYTSWVAELFPYAIVYEAAAVIFRSIGQMEKFRAYRDMASEQYQILRINNIIAAGM
jgi:hypothetical protein